MGKESADNGTDGERWIAGFVQGALWRAKQRTVSADSMMKAAREAFARPERPPSRPVKPHHSGGGMCSGGPS